MSLLTVWVSAQDPGTASSNCGTKAPRKNTGRERVGGGGEEDEGRESKSVEIGKKRGEESKLGDEGG